MTPKRIIAALLTACFLFVHIFGSVMAIEIEHSHAGDVGHVHEVEGFTISTASNHHDHAPAPVNEDEDEDGQPEDDSPHPSHSHLISLSLDASSPPSILAGFVNQSAHDDLALLEEERCPDDPSFDLIKPPQLV